MWVSSTSTDGDIGGVNGATAICETDASGIGGLAPGLTHRAVIATSSNDPRDYFSNNPPVQRPDGTVIIDTYSGFFDDNTNLTNSVLITQKQYWMGLDSDGSASSVSCSDWTTADSGTRGNQGVSDEPVGDNRFYSGDTTCNWSESILCISY